MKTKIIRSRLGAAALFLLTFSLQSCEPDYCAKCYDYSGLFRSYEVYICADDPYELDYLVEDAEYMGYECFYEN